MEKICGVYRIENVVTGDWYIGSSVDVRRRWCNHKKPSAWKFQNCQMYQDMQKYGVDNFSFMMVCFCDEEHLKQVEQDCIAKFNPTYNKYKAYLTEDEKKDYMKDYMKDYFHAHKDDFKDYYQSHASELKVKNNQLCNYNGETLTLCALITRLQRAGIKHSTQEAKKYLIHEA